MLSKSLKLKIKIVFFIVFIFACSFVVYISPYVALSNLMKAAGDEKKEYVIAHFMDERQIKQNIIHRYNIELFGGLDTESIIPEKRAEKIAIEESIKYGVDAIIDPESISNLFFAIKNKNIHSEQKIDVFYTYDGFNTFRIFVKFENKIQEIVLDRYNLIFWKITDIIFPIDYNLFY